MTGVVIYMEGGGPQRTGKAAVRKGMDAFLGSIKRQARRKSLHWRLVPCGPRRETYRRFRDACRNADLRFAPDKAVHLMAQCMETWIVADPEALVTYYGRGLADAKLPKRRDLEQEPKASVERALADATRGTTKGVYHKIAHASELLGQMDHVRVKDRCRHCERLFNALSEIIAAAS